MSSRPAPNPLPVSRNLRTTASNGHDGRWRRCPVRVAPQRCSLHATTHAKGEVRSMKRLATLQSRLCSSPLSSSSPQAAAVPATTQVLLRRSPRASSRLNRRRTGSRTAARSRTSATRRSLRSIRERRAAQRPLARPSALGIAGKYSGEAQPIVYKNVIYVSPAPTTCSRSTPTPAPRNGRTARI